MIEIGLAVGASVGWGASEFVAGVASRTRPMVLVLAGSQVASLVLIACMMPVSGFTLPSPNGVALAAAAGVCEVLGFAALYRALATGPMGPVAPVAALGGIVPMSVSLAAGESLPGAAGLGIALGLVGIVFVSWDGEEHHGRTPARALTGPLVLAGAASLCFGFFFLLLQRATVDADAVSAVAVCRVAAVLTALPLLAFALWGRSPGFTGSSSRWGLDARSLTVIGAIGALDVGANLLYALGTSRSHDVGLQIVASASPVATVLLASIVLRERMNGIQAVGVGLTVGAVLLIGGG